MSDQKSNEGIPDPVEKRGGEKEAAKRKGKRISR